MESETMKGSTKSDQERVSGHETRIFRANRSTVIEVIYSIDLA